MDKIKRPLDVTWDDVRHTTFTSYLSKFGYWQLRAMVAGVATILLFGLVIVWQGQSQNKAVSLQVQPEQVKFDPHVKKWNPVAPPAQATLCELLKLQVGQSALNAGGLLRSHCLKEI